ncbi:hypothetical protein Agub_g7920, partial [Astrephomene gubernaculifera]
MAEGGNVGILEEPLRVASTPTPAVPGRAGKVNYGLHDAVVRLPVLDKVKEAKKATIESKPDILGVRGPVWNGSVELQPGKHHQNFSGTLLSNTLTPNLLNSKDVRKLTGTTACRADKEAALLDRSKSPSQLPGGWNTSTVTPGPREAQRMLAAGTAAAQTATRRCSPPPGYVDPYSRQVAFSTAVRAAKADSGADMQELTARYGPEGAQAMAAILAAQAAAGCCSSSPCSRQGRSGSRPAPRATRADLEAVRALEEWEAGRGVEESEEEEAE